MNQFHSLLRYKGWINFGLALWINAELAKTRFLQKTCCRNFPHFQVRSAKKNSIKVCLTFFRQGLNEIFASRCDKNVKRKVRLKILNQGLIDPVMIFKRDNDRD